MPVILILTDADLRILYHAEMPGVNDSPVLGPGNFDSRFFNIVIDFGIKMPIFS